MLNRTYHLGAREAPLHGFPRRGRTPRVRRLERAGQMRLGFHSHARLPMSEPCAATAEPETIEEAVDYLFPLRPMTEDELFAEFDRLFPPPGS